MQKILLLFISLTLALSCASTKQLGADIESYDETLHLIQKLKKKPNKDRLWVQINRSYPSTIEWFESEIAIAQGSEGAKMKWTNTCSQMMRVNAIGDSIMSIPGWESRISNLKRYTAELDSAKMLAVEECLSQAAFLNKYSNKGTLKIALFYLERVAELDPENKDADALRTVILEKLKAKPNKD